MNPALLYLAVTLLKRRSLLLLDGLRRPLQLLAWVLGGTVLGVLYYYRNSDFVGQFVKNTPLVFFLSLLLIVSFVRALFQRGLVFDQADIEFLLAGPFSQRHLIFYRLIPSYLGAICTVAVFSTLFWNHFPHPMMTSLAIALFQLVCAHLSMAASILSGGLSDRVFSRLRFIACIIVFAYCVLWIQKGLHDAAPLDRPEKWNANAGRILTKLFFYPMAAPQAISPQSNLLPEISGVVETLINAPTSELSLGFSILLLIPLCCFTLKSVSHLKTGLFEPVLKAHDRRSITRNKNR
ncbi:MAG: hypothetical protein JWM99_4727, partial [Verrucomicrobiales bacterium]|nr:hypothetical protein [Verrucomicrobiales bacterium]